VRRYRYEQGTFEYHAGRAAAFRALAENAELPQVRQGYLELAAIEQALAERVSPRSTTRRGLESISGDGGRR
jgi:hypothetical protein